MLSLNVNDDAKMVEFCCMLSINQTPTPLSDKAEKGHLSVKTKERPKEHNQKRTPSAKAANDLKNGFSLNDKIKNECDEIVYKGEFFEGQIVYYFSPKIMSFGTQQFQCVVYF